MGGGVKGQVCMHMRAWSLHSHGSSLTVVCSNFEHGMNECLVWNVARIGRDGRSDAPVLPVARAQLV